MSEIKPEAGEIKRRHHTYYLDFATCPSCGESDADCWELFKESGDPATGECLCGARYSITQEIAVTYCTELVNEGAVVNVADEDRGETE